MPVIADTEITVDFLCGKGGIINFQSITVHRTLPIL
jgi:hypothetical protein